MNFTSKVTDENVIENDPNSFFLATFYDGVIFRNLIDYLKGTTKIAYLVFTAKTITHVQSDPGLNWLNDVTINTIDLLEYKFSSTVPKIVIGIELDRLRERMKIGKKDSIRIYKKANDDNIYVQDITATISDSTGINYFQSSSLEKMEMYEEIPEYTRAEDNPNFVVPAPELAKDFRQMIALNTKNKDNKCIFRGYNSTLVVSLSGQINGGKFKKYGQATEDSDTITVKNKNNEEIGTFLVPNNLIKLWIKLGSISDTSMIRFFFEEDKPMKIVCRIGYFGTLRIYVKGTKE